MEVIPEQYWKTYSPRLFTLFGSVIAVSPDCEKAYSPMLVMLLGSVMVVSPVQS